MASFVKWLKFFQIRAGRFASKDESTTSVTSESSQFPSLDISFNLTKELLSSQRDRIDALDSKANFALTAATGLISAALVLQSLVLPHSSPSCSMLIPVFLHALPPLLKRALPILPLLLIYTIVMVYGINAYKTRKFVQVPNPRTLLMNYLNKPEEDTKAKIFRAMVEFYEQNENEIRKKSILIDYAFISVVIEAILLVMLLLYQVLC